MKVTNSYGVGTWDLGLGSRGLPKIEKIVKIKKRTEEKGNYILVLSCLVFTVPLTLKHTLAMTIPSPLAQ